MASDTPVFKELFRENWSALPEVFRLHYGHRRGREDAITATGTLSVRQSALMRPFAFLFRLSKTLVPVTETGVATKVVFRTRSGSPCFWFDRAFALQNGKVVKFVSRMEPLGGHEVVEWTGARIGWHSTYTFAENRVHLDHVGYRLRLGNYNLSLPLEWLFGRPSAWEEAVGESAFNMKMTIDHRLFGTLYSYAGRFEITEFAFEE